MEGRVPDRDVGGKELRVTTSPAIERLEFPGVVRELPGQQAELPAALTVNRLPTEERAVFPAQAGGTFGEAEWEKVAAGVLAGFGAGIVAAFMLATFAV
jgi:hypothetical protein